MNKVHMFIEDIIYYRFQQQCYLCMERGEEKRAYLGACMPCNKPGCKKVTLEYNGISW